MFKGKVLRWIFLLRTRMLGKMYVATKKFISQVAMLWSYGRWSVLSRSILTRFMGSRIDLWQNLRRWRWRWRFSHKLRTPDRKRSENDDFRWDGTLGSGAGQTFWPCDRGFRRLISVLWKIWPLLPWFLLDPNPPARRHLIYDIVGLCQLSSNTSSIDRYLNISCYGLDIVASLQL